MFKVLPINPGDSPMGMVPKLNYNFSIFSGISGNIEVGSPVNGSSPTQVLYTNNNGSLSSDLNFTRDSSFSATNINTGNYFANQFFGANFGSGGFGDSNGSTLFGINSANNYFSYFGVSDGLNYPYNTSLALWINSDNNDVSGILLSLDNGQINQEIIVLASSSFSGYTENSSITLKSSGITSIYQPNGTNQNNLGTGFYIGEEGIVFSVSGVNWNWMHSDGNSGDIIKTDNRIF